MSAVQLFEYGDHAVRTSVRQDGEVLFARADVCSVLGIVDARQATERLDADERGVFTAHPPNGGAPVELAAVTEPGLYSLILGSRRPEARAFKRWVTHDVLPELRQSGRYEVEPAIPAPRLPVSYADALRELAATVEERDAAREQVAELEPAASAWTAMDSAEGDYSVREAAQLLNRDPAIDTGQNRLFAYLYDVGWVDRTSRPNQAQVDAGRLATRTQTYPHPRTGESVLAKPQIRVTHKGLTELHKRLGGTRSLATGQLAVVQ